MCQSSQVFTDRIPKDAEGNVITSVCLLIGREGHGTLCPFPSLRSPFPHHIPLSSAPPHTPPPPNAPSPIPFHLLCGRHASCGLVQFFVSNAPQLALNQLVFIFTNFRWEKPSSPSVQFCCHQCLVYSNLILTGT